MATGRRPEASWSWRDNCCRCAAPSRTTRWRRRPNSAGVYGGSSKSCSSSCRIQTCRPTTTPLNGASATWSSAERSAAPLDPNRAATARWHWHHSSAHRGPRASIPSPNPAACSFHLNSEQLPPDSPPKIVGVACVDLRHVFCVDLGAHTVRTGRRRDPVPGLRGHG